MAAPPDPICLWRETRLGGLCIEASPQGIRRLGFADRPGSNHRSAPSALASGADHGRVSRWIDAIQAHLDLANPLPELPLELRGTAFQQRVWQLLRSIPPGQTMSYAEVAAGIGAATAVRAVASACAANPVALLVPCHRVLRSDGALGGYRWGLARKQALLAAEAAARH